MAGKKAIQALIDHYVRLFIPLIVSGSNCRLSALP